MDDVRAVLDGRAPYALHHGDCRGVMRDLADASVDLIVTDPPWGIAHDSNFEGSEWAGEIEGDDCVRTDWLPEAARILKPCSALYLFTRWDVESEWVAALRAAGLTVRNSLVWNKGKGTCGLGDIRGAYGFQHERILYATKGRHILQGPRLGDVLDVPAVFSREWKWHPHEKPVDLLQSLIAKSSDPGAVVFDGFAGGASTLVAALAEGRRALGCETDPRWYGRGDARLQGAQRRDPGNLAGQRQRSLFGGRP